VQGFLARMLVSAIGLWLASALIADIHFSSVGSLLAAALLLGLVNAVIRPMVVLLTLPLTFVTFGLFLLAINGAMLALVAWLLSGFSVGGLGSAVLGAVVVGLTSWIASWYIGPNGRFEVMVIERRGT
jgi:putative membrane protein